MTDAKSYRESKRAAAATKGNAKSLRKAMNASERALWVALRGRKIGGLKFRRQAPLGSYIADFYCHEIRLVVEVDGSTHNNRQNEDAKRDQWMSQLGIRVLRVQSNDVLKNMDGVVRTILHIAQEPPPSR